MCVRACLPVGQSLQFMLEVEDSDDWLTHDSSEEEEDDTK